VPVDLFAGQKIAGFGIKTPAALSLD